MKNATAIRHTCQNRKKCANGTKQIDLGSHASFCPLCGGPTLESRDLEGIIYSPTKESTSEQKLDSRIEELSKDMFGVENSALSCLIDQRLESITPISPKFLSSPLYMGASVFYKDSYDKEKTEKISIIVPKYGVYSLRNPVMSIRQWLDRGFFSANTFLFKITSPCDIPPILSHSLVQTQKDFKWCFPDHIYTLDNAYYFYLFGKTRKKFNQRFTLDGRLRQVEISSAFGGLIPPGKRNEIRFAQNLFGEDIFIVAETRPSDWYMGNTPKATVSLNPRIIGVRNNKIYPLGEF